MQSVLRSRAHVSVPVRYRIADSGRQDSLSGTVTAPTEALLAAVRGGYATLKLENEDVIAIEFSKIDGNRGWFVQVPADRT